MVVVKYKKIDEGMFFSHINVIRIWGRIIAVSGIEVNASPDGKQKNLFFSYPTRVGVESLCEYIVIDTNTEAKEVEAKIENNLPTWLGIENVYDVPQKFNVASMNSYAKYFITFEDYKSCKPKIQEFFSQEEIVISYMLHGEVKTQDVKPRILAYKLEEQGLSVVAGVGENSIRIDEFVKKMLEYLSKTKQDFKITKTELFAEDEEGKLTTIDKLAKNLEKKE